MTPGYYKLLLSFFLCAFLTTVAAQQEYLFTHLGTREGLLSNDVVAAQQDAKGFIWIATFSGLQRYDGSRLLTFRHKANDTTTIPNNLIVYMKMDKQNRLWILCDNNGIGYFNTDNFTFHPVLVRADKDLLSKAERHLFMDEVGNIFLRLSGAPLLRYNEATREFTAVNALFKLPPNWHPIWVYQDKQAYNYWIACDSGLVKYNPKARTLSYRNHNLDNDAVIAQYAPLTYTTIPYFDSKGRFWILSWPPAGGLTVLSFDTQKKQVAQWQTVFGKLLHYVYYEIDAIQELNDSTLWFSGNNIFATFNNKINNFDIIQNNLPGEYSIRYDMVYSLNEDREHNLWACTNKGLYRFNPSAQLFHTISIKRTGKDSVYTPDVANIMQTRKGDLLVSTWGSGLFPYDSSLLPKTLEFTYASFVKGNQFVWCTHEQANGDIWCGHQAGTLYIIHPGTDKIERLQLPVFEKSTIRQVVEDKAGNLWFGTQNGLLVKWNAATNTFTQMQRQLSTVFRLYIDWQGAVWVCTKTNGVYKINTGDGSIVQHYTAAGAATSRLMTIGSNDIKQYNDSIYIIASGGVNVLNTHTNTIRYLNINDDAFSNMVTNVVVDRQALLWVTTQSGLFSINLETGVATSYNESDGLQSNYFNPGSACMLNDGRVALGTIHNFVVFNPVQVLQTEVFTPTVAITGFALMNNWLPMDSLAKQKTIELPYDQNSLTIAFSTLYYQTAYAISYKLDGLDKQWITAKANEAIYSYLPPGTYTFQIQAVNANNVRSKTITTLSITVLAPFWRTWWFYSLLLLVAMAFLYWLDKERTKRKTVLQTMRSNISGNLHEEINKALQNINVLSEIARIKADKEPKQSQNYIDEIHHKSNSLIEAMDDMLWSIDPANDTMQHTINRMTEIAHAISHQFGTTIQVHHDDKVIGLKPDMERRHELMIIYKMALQLLAQQMRAHHILVELSYIKSHVQLNMFAGNIKLHNSSQVQDTISSLKAKAATLKSSLEVQNDEKGVGIILSVKR